jgi:hypothetical protein
MKNKIFATLLFISIFLTNKSFAQISTSLIGKNITLVTPTLPNLIYMYNLSIPTWEKEMKSIGFVYRDKNKGGIIYFTGDTFSRGGIEYIAKYADAISILWAYSGDRFTIMDELEEFLQAHFLNRNEDWSVYRFKYGEHSYAIEMKREKESEHLIFKKVRD